MISERQLLKIQKQRHLYDIKIMILNNSLLKNLSERDQKKMIKLIYKAEILELHARDRQIVRVNQSFEDIMKSIIEGGAFLDDEKNPFRDDDEL
ncbi:hypothetical protein EBR43_04900 [bacterium]|nr:hypothetical protein [bacterium]